MSNSTSNSRWEDDSNRPHKKPRYDGKVIEEDGDSSSPFHEKKRIINNIPESDWWVATRYLGSGSYGSVHLAISDVDHRYPHEIVIKSNEISQASRLMIEEQFLTRLKSPFVVSCYGYEIDDIYYNLMLEYCPGQCLAKYMEKRGGRGLGEDDVKRFASDILVGLKYIHGEKIIHRDIKPKNILLVADDKNNNRFRAKISGFGKAIEKKRITIGDRSGTTRFMSPEIIIRGWMVWDYGGDVWAFGCTVLEMLTGERVWGEHGDQLDLEDWIAIIGESDLLPYVPDSLSQEAQDFLSKCLHRDPAKRWSVDRLLKHRFLGLNYPQEEIGDEAYLEEEEEEVYDEIGDAEVEAYEAYLEEDEEEEEEEEVYEEKEEAIEIDEEYPKEEDSEEE